MGDTFHDTNNLIKAPVIGDSDQPERIERRGHRRDNGTRARSFALRAQGFLIPLVAPRKDLEEQRHRQRHALFESWTSAVGIYSRAAWL